MLCGRVSPPVSIFATHPGSLRAAKLVSVAWCCADIVLDAHVGPRRRSSKSAQPAQTAVLDQSRLDDDMRRRITALHFTISTNESAVCVSNVPFLKSSCANVLASTCWLDIFPHTPADPSVPAVCPSPELRPPMPACSPPPVAACPHRPRRGFSPPTAPH